MSDKRTVSQNDTLQDACHDLARDLTWFGKRLTNDDWRALIVAAVMRARIVPGIPLGEGAPGMVALIRSSTRLTKPQFSEAIALSFSIGDTPWEYDASQTKSVAWSESVLRARGWNPEDLKMDEFPDVTDENEPELPDGYEAETHPLDF